MKHRVNKLASPGVTALSFTALVWAPGAARADDGEQQALAALQKRVAELAVDRRVTPARVGVAVARVRTGDVLVKLRQGEKFNIASNVKLITAAAALKQLGPAHRFKTSIFAPRRKGAVVQGDLYLKGYGDPDLQVSDLWRMVQTIHHRGVREIKGGVVVDESYFDRARNPPLFATRKTTKYYRTTNGPLALRYNKMSVLVHGGATVGAPGLIQVSPASSYFKLVNKTMTVNRGRGYTQIKKIAGRGTFEILGTARVGRRGKRATRRIEDPGLVTGHALLDLLRRRGIKVHKDQVRRGKARWTRRPLARHTSRSLGAILRHMNKRSDNFVAEQLLKVMGARPSPPATWKKGLAAVTAYLTGVGLKPGTYTLKNGSGLYEASSFSPAQVVKVLRAAHQDYTISADYVASLAIAGLDGTMDYRCKKGLARRHVRAKTGTLARVVTLSGFAGSSTGAGLLAFSILFNDLPPRKIRGARKVADEMVEAMVQYLERGKRGAAKGKGRGEREGRGK